MRKKLKPVPKLFTPDLFTGEMPEKIKRPYNRHPKPRRTSLIQPTLEDAIREAATPLQPAATPKSAPVKDAVHEYLSKIGRKGGLVGGKARSPAKARAARANAKLPRKKKPF